jgi:hypothetical protein
VVDQPLDRLALGVAALVLLDVEFFIHDLLYPQLLRQLMPRHHARVARQLLFPKANPEFPDLTNDTLGVHLLGASLQGNGAVPHRPFC